MSSPKRIVGFLCLAFVNVFVNHACFSQQVDTQGDTNSRLQNLVLNIGNTERYFEYDPVNMIVVLNMIDKLGKEQWLKEMRQISLREKEEDLVRNSLQLILRMVVPEEPLAFSAPFFDEEPSFCKNRPMYVHQGIPFRLVNSRYHAGVRSTKYLLSLLEENLPDEAETNFVLPDNPISVLVSMKSNDNWIFDDRSDVNFERRRMCEIQCLQMVKSCIPKELVDRLELQSLFDLENEPNRCIWNQELLEARFAKIISLAEAIEGKIYWDSVSQKYRYKALVRGDRPNGAGWGRERWVGDGHDSGLRLAR